MAAALAKGYNNNYNIIAIPFSGCHKQRIDQPWGQVSSKGWDDPKIIVVWERRVRSIKARRGNISRNIFLTAVLIIAGYLSLFGFILLKEGGSAYYFFLGLALFLSAILIWSRRRFGVWLYAVAILTTIGWALWESGLDGWALLPRVISPLIFSLPLLLPNLRNGLAGPVPFERLASLPGFLIATFAVSTVGLAAHTAAAQPVDPIYQAGTAKFDRDVVRSTAAEDADWTRYAGGHESRFSTLSQIDASNLADLKVAWTYRVGMPKDPQLTSLAVTPLKVGDSLYLCTPENIVVALDAETGQQLWRFDSKVDTSGLSSTATCRGVSYHAIAGAEGACATRIYTNTIDARLIALDSRNGTPCADFGVDGQVSLLVGMGSVTKGYYYVSSPPAVIHGKVVLGGWVSDNQFWGEPSGVIRAFDAVTGRLAWAFDMGRPDRKGEPAIGEHYTRSTPNSWAPMAIDEELGLVFAPTGNATPDNFGGRRRPFDEEYSSSVIALDAQTGNVRWSFQTTHHDLWDYDVPSQPALVDLPRRAGALKLLVQATKRGDLFVLDRVTGKPWAKVIERKVPSEGGAPGERIAPTQPFAVGMPSVGGPDLTEGMMWGLTPLDQLWCRIEFRKSRYEGVMTPLAVGQFTIVSPGFAGGSNWGSVSIDPDRGVIVANAVRMAFRAKLIPRAEADKLGLRPLGVSNGSHGVGGPAAQANTPFAVMRYPFVSPLNVPCQQPPYGTISGIDLKSRKLLWTKAFGTARDIGPLNIPSQLPFTLGVPNFGGALTTGSGLTFIGATQDRYFRAFDTTTGQLLWQDRIPAGGQATPMTYMSSRSGRQFVVLAAGGSSVVNSKTGDFIIAYSLARRGNAAERN